MYKVFINEKSIVLTDRRIPEALGNNTVYLTYEDFEELNYLLNLLETSDLLQGVIFYHDDLEMLWADFRAHYNEIDAAGGLVRNDNDEILLIHRRGKWDLPKGKLDEGETPEEAALREVEEECSVSDLRLGHELLTTYHTYEEKGVRYLKRTFWYEMRSSQKDLIPQAEESIDKAEWRRINMEALDSLDTYSNIKLLLVSTTGQS